MAMEGFHMNTCFRDILHVVFLGFARSFLASMIADMRDRGLLLGGVKSLWGEVVDWCRVRNIEKPRHFFTSTNTGLNCSCFEQPMLATTFKGATVKLLIMFFATKTSTFPEDDVHLQLMTAASQNLARCLRIWDEAGMILTEVEARESCDAGTAFLIAFAQLTEMSHRARVCRYNLTPKLHYFHHVLLDAKRNRINPRISSLFSEESTLGKLKLVARLTHRATTNARLLARYQIKLSLRFRKSRELGW
jgi:hypothetical protein